MKQHRDLLTIGETARRSGVAASALRFYETKGLIQSHRGSGNQRRFTRSTLRRISVIKVAQTLGLTLEEISNALATLPKQDAPSKQDWERLSTQWKSVLDHRIQSLERIRDQLSGCIGCGCLSLKNCALYNPQDEAGEAGSGARFLIES